MDRGFLSNENDALDAYVEIHAGAGGTESQDWAEMLRRMYSRWAEKNNFRVELIHESRGEEAGIKSSTIKISGQFVYGWLKGESGVHRLVRISPFDSGARRHTSFASAWVYPVVNEDINIQILEKDIRIDTYRSSGAGGQHVEHVSTLQRTPLRELTRAHDDSLAGARPQCFQTASRFERRWCAGIWCWLV